ncbi:hypothetical protein BEN47_14960 [Hymenobacter lapidarius]|uniref:UspA domain-containing protein n=1 Tax=Hymenobacter lapidarius TaxID=1908237 RepID=A0A1G1T3F6_9BACT|nr:universal stress protein [Hymenobacter lapidarius]OGX85413.1 hypothetical protein BEN47_14960 [Hymenobacter lapidarius]
MKPNLVVLTDSSPAAKQARAYAAVLAAALGAEVHLVHVYPTPPMTSRVAVVLQATNKRYVRQERRALEQLAADFPVPATADTLETGWDEAVQQALNQYRPLLLVAGLTATHGQFDEWLSNRTLPLARETGYPLLLVPAHLPAEALHPPRRLVLAVENRPFALTPQAKELSTVFDALATEIITVTVVPGLEPEGGEQGLLAARQSGLAGMMPRSPLHQVVGAAAAPGILEAGQELSADVVAMIDVGHGWAHKLLVDSVIEQVLREVSVPLLLLSAPKAFLDE